MPQNNEYAMHEPTATGARCAHEHVACFYESGCPAATIAEFVGAAMHRGAGAIVIARREHQLAIKRALRDLGVDPGAAVRRGQLVQLDARTTLAELAPEGELLLTRFDSSMGALVQGVASRFGEVRAYDEMVDLLCRAGRKEVAIELEGLWGGLIASEPVALLCGYHLGGFDTESASAAFDRVCRAHCGVLMEGRTTAAVACPERFLAELTHKARVIARETELRQRLEAERAALLVAERESRLAAQAALAQVAGLQRVTVALSEAATTQQIAQVVVTEMATALGASRALLGVSSLDQDGPRLRLLGRAVDGLRAVEERGECSVAAEQPIANAFRAGLPRWLTAPGAEGSGPLVLDQAPMRALAALPLRVLGTTLGVVAFGYATERCFTASERALHEDMARQASLALHRVGLFEAMQEEREWSERLSRLLAEHLQTVETLRQQKVDLMAFVAHDFKNPLCCVGLCVRRMLRNPGLDDNDRSALRDLETAADQVQRMALDLVDISRSEAGQILPRRRTIDLQILVQEVVGWAEPQASERRQSIDWSTDGGDSRMDADPELLRRVLANLLDNALKYVPRLGRIRVDVRLAHPAAVGIRVSDDGPGIPAAQHERIFDKFVQLEDAGASQARGSRGLGLAFCRVAIEAHGGRIWVENMHPSGVAFCLRLPRGTVAEATVDAGAHVGSVSSHPFWPTPTATATADDEWTSI